MIRQALLMMIMLTSCTNHAAIVLKGDEQAASGETFSFTVDQYRMSRASDFSGANFYVAAAPSEGGAGKVKQFSVSQLMRESTQFIGLAPEKVKINGSKEEIANPLYDQGVAYMALFYGPGSVMAGATDRPVVVLNGDKKTIYLINSYNAVGGNVELLSASNGGNLFQNVPDATGAITSGIVALQSRSPYIFAAAAPNGGSFGAAGSGIALVLVGEFPVANNTNFTGPVIVDAPTGNPAYPGGNRAVAVNVTLDSLKIGANLASIGTVVDMHWDEWVGRLYISLQVTGGAAGTDGARALLVGQITKDNSLVLYPIAPTSAFDNSGQQIIGTIGANSSVSMHKVRTMFTSTAMPYLIVQGDVGSPSATKRSVYALPLVNVVSDALNGTIADKNAAPTNIYTETTTPLFASRAIKTAATTPSQMPLSTDRAAQVGRGMLIDGDISDMYVYGDTVFVTVKTSDLNYSPGVFYSQAIFQADGKIKAWTKWRRAVGTTNHVKSVVLDPLSGKFITLVANNGVDVKTVKRTEWSTGAVDGFSVPISAVAQYMPDLVGGVQGLFDFILLEDIETPGLHDISAMVATGMKKVMLIQTSSNVLGSIVPLTGSAFGTLTQFTDGTIGQTLPIAGSNMIGISGGALDDLGAIVAAEFARSPGSNGYLFVGGTGGLAVLSKADGSGWNTATGLGNGFSGLTSGMSFKKIGDYANVCKIINDGDYLYVLTNNQLDRIDLTAGNIGLGQITAVTVATNALMPGITIQGTFLDAVISQDLLIIATNAGLMRLGDGLDVRTIQANGAAWRRIDAPETIGPMQQLLVISPTCRAQAAATSNEGSYLLALSAYRGKNQAQLARYSISSTDTTGVTSSTVQRFDDQYVKDIPSYFASFGQFQAVAATDGSLYYATRNQTELFSAFVSALFAPGGVQTGSRFLSNNIIPVQELESTIIAAMVQNSASGSWLVAGNGGIRANE